MKFKLIFLSPWTTALFFGLVNSILTILYIQLPLRQNTVDFLTLSTLILTTICSLVFLKCLDNKDNFPRLFLTSILTFSFFPVTVFSYFYITTPGSNDGNWTLLLVCGLVSCFILALFVDLIRRPKSHST